MNSSPARLSRLILNGKEYNVFQAGFESYKPVDQWNRVTAYAVKADARFVIEGTEETSKIFELYANSRKTFHAKLILNAPNGEGKLTEVDFRDCSLTYFATKFSTFDEIPYTVTIVLNPREVVQDQALLSFDQNTRH